MNSYPFVNFLVRYGARLVDAVSIALVAAAIVAVAAYGWAWPWGLLGVMIGTFVFIVGRSLVELLQIIADTLVPR